MYLTSLSHESHPRPVSLSAVVKVEMKVFWSTGQGVRVVAGGCRAFSKWLSASGRTRREIPKVIIRMCRRPSTFKGLGCLECRSRSCFFPCMRHVGGAGCFDMFSIHVACLGKGEQSNTGMYCIGTHQYFIHFLAYAVWGGSFIGQTHAPTLGGKICSSLAANERWK